MQNMHTKGGIRLGSLIACPNLPQNLCCHIWSVALILQVVSHMASVWFAVCIFFHFVFLCNMFASWTIIIIIMYVFIYHSDTYY